MALIPCRVAALAALASLLLAGCATQTISPAAHQDVLLPEQYVWFSAPSPDSSSPRFFRKAFQVSSVPARSTLYFTGPYGFTIFLNGTLLRSSSLSGPGVVHDRPVAILDVSTTLRTGNNVLAIQASAGELLAAKLVPADLGIDSAPLLVSDSNWKAATVAPAGWEQPGFDDSSWLAVKTFGSIEADPRNFEWNLDLGLYQWPGYQGLNRTLAHRVIAPQAVTPLAPNTLLLDFGAERTGRVQLSSRSQLPIAVLLTHGESEEEASGSRSYLGDRELSVPPGATAAGPLTAFRYVRLTFENGASPSSAQVALDEVSSALPLRGGFQCSDEQLNRIWQTSIDTARLSLQASYWDAPKRDRKPFSGDLFVAARTARIVFGDTPLVRGTLAELLRREFIEVNTFTTPDINNIASYNAFWVLDLADEYQFTGDLNYLRGNQNALIGVLETMRTEVGANSLFSNVNGALIFADWSPGMLQFGSLQGPDAVAITTFVYAMGFDSGAQLLRELGDNARAQVYAQLATAMRSAARATYFDPNSGSFGPRTQTNAMAIFSGIATDTQAQTSFQKVLAQPPSAPVSPYFNYFVLSAMAQTGHRAEALELVRGHWGSMLSRGATTFWELYDPKCIAAANFHSCLMDYLNSFDPQGTDVLFVSLAHAWSSGPAPWMMQEIIGIHPLSPGFRNVLIRPDLAGLQWASGVQPTLQGDISVSIASSSTVSIQIPAGIQATVSMPTPSGNPVVQVNGQPTLGTLAEGGTRTLISLGPGSFFLQSF